MCNMSFRQVYSLDPFLEELTQKKSNRIAERFCIILQKVHEELCSVPDSLDEAIHKLVELQTRNQLFRVEGLLRLYSKIYGTNAEELLVLVKEFEDAIGKFAALQAYETFAIDIAAPKKVIQVITQQKNDAHLSLKFVIADHWSPKEDGTIPAIRSIFDWLRNETLLKNKKERTELLKVLAKEIKKVHKKKFNMQALQAGVHEYRRKIRWFPIYIAALDGLIQLKPEDTAYRCHVFDSFLEDKILTESPHSIIQHSDQEKKPTLIAKPYFLALNHFIAQFGDIKDKSENRHSVIEAYLLANSKIDFATAEQRTERLIKIHIRRSQNLNRRESRYIDTGADYFSKANELYYQILDSKLLKHLEREISPE